MKRLMKRLIPRVCKYCGHSRQAHVRFRRYWGPCTYSRCLNHNKSGRCQGYVPRGE